MSRRTSTALCLICAIFMVFNLLASVLVSAEPDNTSGITSDTSAENVITADPEQTTADPNQPTDTPDQPSDTSDQTTADPDTPPSPLTPVAFEINIPADFPIAYRTGDKFSTEGLSGTITYNDGTTATTTNIICDAPNPLNDTITSISFSCEEAPELEAATTLTISVAAITEINVSGDSVTATYYEGDTFGDEEIAALTITVLYSDGTSKEVSHGECKFLGGTNAPMSLVAPYILIEYCEFVQRVDLKVIELPKLTGIKVSQTATFDNRFTEGDLFDPTGLMIMAIYSGGKNPEVIGIDGNFSAVQFSPALDVPLSTSDTSVTVTYTDGTDVFTATIDIIVAPDAIASIRVSKVPNKLIHYEGDIFDYTGMELTVVYENGTALIITENFTVSHTDTPFILKNGISTIVDIEITYLDKSCILPVQVLPKDVDSVTVAAPPTKLIYNEGDIFNPQGLLLKMKYVDKNIPDAFIPADYYEISPSTPLTANDTYVEINFRGETVRIDITVIPAQTEPGTTAPIDPPVTPDDPTPPSTTDETTVPPVVTDPSVTTPESPSDATEETTASPADITTTGGNEGDGGNTTLVVLWIIILSVIVIALVVLIIYYKRNFT